MGMLKYQKQLTQREKKERLHMLAQVHIFLVLERFFLVQVGALSCVVKHPMLHVPHLQCNWEHGIANHQLLVAVALH